MIKTEKKFTYKAFGLSISSYLYLPELHEININEDLAEIVVEKASLSTLWTELAESNDYFIIKENFILFRIPEVAIFLIQKGKEIFVSPIGVDVEDIIRLYTLGTCMGAILMQRRILPLHGSAIAIDGKAYAIVGDSGAGKSTLASAFLKRGYKLISDDVIPVSLNEENIPMVTPAYPQQKLWIESLDHFGMESNHYRPIIDRESKFAVPVSSQFASEPLPLAGIFELVKTENYEIELHPIHKLHRLHLLFNHTYRNFFIAGSGLMQWHFDTTAKIVYQIDLYQLHRPTSHFTAHDLTDLILSTINKEDKVI